MRYILAVHALSEENRNITFGLSPDGKIWLATDTGNADPKVKPDYFSFKPETFKEVIRLLDDFYTRAARYNLTGKLYNEETGEDI